MTLKSASPGGARVQRRLLSFEADRIVLAVGGSIIGLFGAGMAIAGFVMRNGEFFLFAGFGLVTAGGLMARRHWAGVWAYLAVFGVTLAWALMGNGAGESPLLYRLAGPVVMLLMLALLVPAFGRRPRRNATTVLILLILVTISLGNQTDNSKDPVTIQGRTSARLAQAPEFASEPRRPL